MFLHLCPGDHLNKPITVCEGKNDQYEWGIGLLYHYDRLNLPLLYKGVHILSYVSEQKSRE